MNVYKEPGSRLHTFLTSELDGEKLSALAVIPPRKEPPSQSLDERNVLKNI
jgi:hypothetical protein